MNVFYHRTPAEKLLVGKLLWDKYNAAFEYAAEFLTTGLELSEIKLPLKPGVFTADVAPFDGLFGLFEDSLPDGWGCVLLNRYVDNAGGDSNKLTPLDRLTWVGSRAIGALSYEPAHEMDIEEEVLDLHALGQEAQLVLHGKTSDALATLLRIGGSPQGARPKALVLLSDDGSEVLAGVEYREGYTPFLVKFAAQDDSQNAAGAVEYAYSRMAQDAGLDMPATRLLGATGRQRGHFAIERFDRRGEQRIHTHTVAGLHHVRPGVAFLGYDDLLGITSGLTHDAQAVKEMFRRAAFNVFSHNRDDHTRNFAFMMEPDGIWKLAPAYDLTFNNGPGFHHTSDVMGETKDPGKQDLLRLADETNIKERDARQIVDKVQEVCARWRDYAKEARVPVKERTTIWNELKRKK